jgi:biopolymer transport protein ExbD
VQAADTGRRRTRVMAEINMIPLIDVALVLLVIFMVMTPFLVKSQIKINLPKAKQAEAAKATEKAFTLQVEKDGTVCIDGERVAAEALDAAIQRALPNPEQQPVMIEADKDVAFQHVIVVMDAVKKHGGVKLGVSVKHDTGRGRK